MTTSKAIINISALYIANAFFGFFIYNFLLIKNIQIFDVGGYFSYNSLIYLIVIIPLLIIRKRYTRYVSYDNLIFILFVYYLISTFILSSASYSENDLLLANNYIGYIKYIMNVLALYLSFRYTKDFSVFKRVWGLLSVTIFSLLLYEAFLNDTFVLKYDKEIYDKFDQLSTYQGLGRSVLLLFTLSVATYKNITTKYILCFMGLFSTFMISARSEFIGSIIVLFLLFFSTLKTKNIPAILSLLVVSSLILFWITQSLNVEENRVLQLTDIENDTSHQARVQILQKGLEDIYDFFIAGRFGGEVLSNSTTEGLYIHNILSVWRQFGLLPFLVYSLLLISSVVISIYHMILQKKRRSATTEFAFYLSVITFVFLLGAKSFSYLMFGAMLGSLANLLSYKKGNKSITTQ